MPLLAGLPCGLGYGKMGLEEELFKLSMMGVKGKKRECSRQGEWKVQRSHGERETGCI